MSTKTTEWDTYATGFIQQFGSGGRTFSANDLWEAGLREPPCARRLGPVLVKASRQGLIRQVGLDLSVRANGSLIRRWVLAR